MTLYHHTRVSEPNKQVHIVGKDRKTQLTISKVQTLRTQTFNCPSTPSTPSSSTPSHQHLLAGFLQKSSNFCAIPTELALLWLLVAGLEGEEMLLALGVAFAVLSEEDGFWGLLMSVRRRARAREQMTALLGSLARWPQVSSA